MANLLPNTALLPHLPGPVLHPNLRFSNSHNGTNHRSTLRTLLRASPASLPMHLNPINSKHLNSSNNHSGRHRGKPHIANHNINSNLTEEDMFVRKLIWRYLEASFAN